MKRIIQHVKIVILTACFFSFASCDFAEKNINPNSSNTIEISPLLTRVQLSHNNKEISKRTQIGFCMMMVQQTASLEREEMAGDKYLKTEALGRLFTESYADVIKNIQELVRRTKDEPTLESTYAVALIWRTFLFHRITDMYGEIPFFEAGDGYVSQIFFPKYDTQKDIYIALIDDLKDAIELLNVSTDPIVSGDIIYQGKVDKWRKFAASMMLRLGMRMEHADATLSEATVKKAIELGVMQEFSDACVLEYELGRSSTENPLSNMFKEHDLLTSGAVKISKTFLDQLKATNDPRLYVYSALPNGVTAFETQKGLPNGYDILNIKTGDPSYTSLADYSTFNPATILKLDAPAIYLSHAEVLLLRAEAVLKGWISGDANLLYQEAVRSSMKLLAVYGEEGVISDEEIESYLNQDLFTKATTLREKLNVIGIEYWVATFMNGIESYANWRRTGYPYLKPTNYAGSPYKGKIPRRFCYPTEEYSVNLKQLQVAIDRQGKDDYTTCIWWDKR